MICPMMNGAPCEFGCTDNAPPACGTPEIERPKNHERDRSEAWEGEIVA